MSDANLRPSTVAARSASSRMIAADLPPSSRVTRLSCWPQTVAMDRPAAVEPVKETLSTSLCATRYAPTSRPAGTMLTTPSGTPAGREVGAYLVAHKDVDKVSF